MAAHSDPKTADRPAAELTKRELFAAMAMQGLLANYEAQKDICDKDPRYNEGNFSGVLALNSVEFADALLKRLEPTNAP